MANMAKVLAMVLAGGEGRRLSALCEVRAKPAVPFAGKYRMIDFSLSNCVNSGIFKVAVITQYRPRSLQEHLGIGRPWDLDRQEGGLRLLQPYLGREGSTWYQGTADAVYQNLYFIEEQKVDLVLVLAGDHIYKMDYSQMADFHQRQGADVTVAVSQVSVSDASRFGIVTGDREGRVVGFEEKPEVPTSNLVSMGIYLFNREPLVHCLLEDTVDPSSAHDFGRSLLPRMIRHHQVFAYPFHGYWRDVGTVPSYWETHMDLLRDTPALNLYDDWVIHTRSEERASALLTETARVERSLISHGCIIEGLVEGSVLSPGVRVGRGAVVRDSIVLGDTLIGPNSLIDRSILDKQVSIGEGCQVGVGDNNIPNQEEPGYLNTGITLVGKECRIPAGTQIGRNCKICPWATEQDFPARTIPSGATVHAQAGQPAFRV